MKTTQPEVFLEYDRLRNSELGIRLRNQIAEANQGLVRYAAHRVKTDTSIPYDDLFQIGFLGLIKAVEHYDVRRGTAFSTFAVHYIRGEILHYRRDKESIGKIPRKWRETLAKSKLLIRQHLELTGRQPSENWLSQKLGCDLQQLRQIRACIQNQAVVSLLEDHDRATYDDPEESPTDLSWLWDSLKSRMEALPPLQRRILQGIYYQHKSKTALARELNLSVAIVRKKMERGLQTLAMGLERWDSLSPESASQIRHACRI